MKFVCSTEAIQVSINGAVVGSITSLHDGTYTNGQPTTAPQFAQYQFDVPNVAGGGRWNFISIKEFRWSFGNIFHKISIKAQKYMQIYESKH